MRNMILVLIPIALMAAIIISAVWELHSKSRLDNKGEKKLWGGIDLIMQERQRQVNVEGWTAEHDNEHIMGEMIGAAVTYAAHALEIVSNHEIPGADEEGWWPWDEKWWKPSPDVITNLVKAGALIAAEIDRLQRMRRDAESAKETNNGQAD